MPFPLSQKNANDPDSPVLDIVSHILGSGTSSLLYRELKERLSLVTSISSSHYSMRHSGVFMVSGTLIEKNIDKVIKEIIHNIQKVVSLDFEPTQIERAKNSILSDDLHENETVQGQAQTIGYLESLTGNLNSKKEYLDRIVDVSPDDISKVSSEFLRLENLNLNIIFPKESLIKEKQHFEDLISDSFSRNPSVKNEQSESYLPKDYSMSDILYEKPKLLKLDNGISLLVLQNNKTPLFSLRSISLGGLKYETQESNGKFSIMAELF